MSSKADRLALRECHACLHSCYQARSDVNGLQVMSVLPAIWQCLSQYQLISKVCVEPDRRQGREFLRLAHCSMQCCSQSHSMHGTSRARLLASLSQGLCEAALRISRTSMIGAPLLPRQLEFQTITAALMLALLYIAGRIVATARPMLHQPPGDRTRV